MREDILAMSLSNLPSVLPYQVFHHTYIYLPSILPNQVFHHTYLFTAPFTPLYCEQDFLCCRTFYLMLDCPSSWVKLLSLPLKCLCCVCCTFSCPTDFFGWTSWGICDLRTCKETVADEEVKVAQVSSPTLNQWEYRLCLMPQKGDSERHELLP